MRACTEAALARAAADLLDYLQSRHGPFSVRITDCDGFAVIVPVRVWPEPLPPAPPPAGGRPFSSLESKIVNGLSGRGWMVTADLAALIGEEPSPEFRCLVRNLGEAGVIETSQKHGLRLVEPA